MDELHTRRIVALVDMDCFYCQVECRLNPDLMGKPVAVVQYNQWKQGGIVAVSYEARARGVTRFMRGEEATKVCPELNLVSVPCVRGKADLTKYREAGVEVAAVFTSFSDCVQRASVDEAFIDLTDVVEKRIASESLRLSPDDFPSTFVVGYCDMKTNDADVRLKGTTSWLHSLLNTMSKNSPEYRLTVGALVVEEMRAEVFKKTGFTCSAGIAHNKILAKVIAGLHKPNCQTLLPHDSVPSLYETLPVHKVRTLGGKFGKLVAEKLSISYMSELYQFSKKELQSIFDEKQGSWLYDIARGIDYDPVCPRLIPDSIGCCKNFRGKMALSSPDAVMHWLGEMAEEVAERLGKDFAENKRKAKLLTVVFKTEESLSRSCPLTSYQASGIAGDAFEVLKKFNKATNSAQWDPPLTHLGLSASKFTSEAANTITKFFKTGQSIERKDGAAGKSDIAQIAGGTNDPNKATIESETIETSKPKSVITNYFNIGEIPERNLNIATNEARKEEHNVVESRKFEEQSSELLNGDGKMKPSGKSTNSFFAKFVTRKKTIEDVPEQSKFSEEENISTNAASSVDLEYLAIPEPSTSHTSSFVDIPGTSTCEDFMETCPECNERVHLNIYLDHLDYHAAVRLDKEINGKVAVKTVTIARSPRKRKGSPLKKKRKGSNGVSANQHAITSFFGVNSK